MLDVGDLNLKLSKLLDLGIFHPGQRPESKDGHYREIAQLLGVCGTRRARFSVSRGSKDQRYSEYI